MHLSSLLVTATLLAPSLALPVTTTKSLAPRGGNGSGKRGIAYNDPSAVSALSSSCSWSYNWGSHSDSGSPPATGSSDPSSKSSGGPEYVPMLWGPKFFKDWDSSKAVGSTGAKYVLGFNEPDIPEQANMSPQEAVTAFKQFLSPLAKSVAVGSPGVTSSEQGNMGLTWMKSFLDICGGDCGIDFLVVHWYGPTSHVEPFKGFISRAVDLAKEHNIEKIWLTEFRGDGDEPSQVNFLKEVLPFLDGNEAVERYAYFMADDLVKGGQLSEVGKVYAGQ